MPANPSGDERRGASWMVQPREGETDLRRTQDQFLTDFQARPVQRIFYHVEDETARKYEALQREACTNVFISTMQCVSAVVASSSVASCIRGIFF